MLFAIPASSSSIERSFSSAGHIVDGREQLTLDTLEKITTIRDYIHQPEYSLERVIQMLDRDSKSGPTEKVGVTK